MQFSNYIWTWSDWQFCIMHVCKKLQTACVQFVSKIIVTTAYKQHTCKLTAWQQNNAVIMRACCMHSKWTAGMMQQTACMQYSSKIACYFAVIKLYACIICARLCCCFAVISRALHKCNCKLHVKFPIGIPHAHHFYVRKWFLDFWSCY